MLVADAPAFVVNRLLTRFLGEVTSAVEQGTPVAVADRALDPLGLPMTPFDLLTLVGPPVALHVAERMHEAFPDRFSVGEGLRKMVELGKSSVYSEPGVVDPDLGRHRRRRLAADRGRGARRAPSGRWPRRSG